MNVYIKQRIESNTSEGSRWIFNKILRYFIIINRYSPLTASSYFKLQDIIIIF